MPSRRRSGNLIKRKLHPEIIEIANKVIREHSSKGLRKYSSIQEFISDIYNSNPTTRRDNDVLKCYYYKCRSGGFTPPPLGKFVKESEYSDFRYVIS